MEIQEIMDPQVVEDSHQDEVHLEEADPPDHQEDQLVPLETQDPWKSRTPRPTGTPRTCRTPRTSRTSNWTTLCSWKSASPTSSIGYLRSRKNFYWNGRCCIKTGSTASSCKQLNKSKRTKKRMRRRKASFLDIAHASHQNTFQHILATIPYYDGTGEM